MEGPLCHDLHESESDSILSMSIVCYNGALQLHDKINSSTISCLAKHAPSIDAGIGSECSSDSGSWRGADSHQSCTACDAEQSVNSWLEGTKSPPNKSYHRSSSLKTTHSDGSLIGQGQKKAVRFADALGLDLAEVKHFIDDTCPTLPAWHTQQQHRFKTRTLKPAFDSSRLRLCCCACTHFQQRVQQRKVCLESVSVNGFTLVGTVRVLNLAFEKNVLVRYTTDFWISSSTVQATYVAKSNYERQHEQIEIQTDAFAFTLVVPTDVRDYSIVELCICYRVAGSEYWDNDGGRNYAFDVIVEDLDCFDGGYLQ